MKIDWNKWDAREVVFSSNRGECRNCKHGEALHLKNQPACNYNDYYNTAKCVPPGYVSEILIPRDRPSGLCPCLRYIPGNNLDYLEWKSGQDKTV